MTQAPTLAPSLIPTTSLPTAAPSITGSVAIIELSKPVTESLSETEVNDIQSQAADAYGVDAEDITVEVVYQTTGTLDIDVTGDVSEEELEEALEEEIAALLGVHEGNVNVNITDGVAYYTITSDSAETASDVQDTLNQAETTSTLDEAIEDEFPTVEVSSVNVDEDVTAEVIVTVDTSSAENNLNNAAENLEESFEDQGYTADAESNFSHKINSAVEH